MYKPVSCRFPEERPLLAKSLKICCVLGLMVAEISLYNGACCKNLLTHPSLSNGVRQGLHLIWRFGGQE